MVEFGGTYTREEWLSGLGLAMRPSKRDLVLRLIAAIIAVTAIGLFAGSLLQGDRTHATRTARTALTGVFLLAWAVWPYLKLRWIAMREWKALAGQGGLQGFATNEGLVTNAATKLEPWASFLKAIRRDDMIVLIGSDGLATILPRRFVATESAWQDLAQWVEFNVTPLR